MLLLCAGQRGYSLLIKAARVCSADAGMLIGAILTNLLVKVEDEADKAAPPTADLSAAAGAAPIGAEPK